MVWIDIVYEGMLKESTGRWEEKVELSDNATVKELLGNLSKKYGHNFQKLFFDPENGQYREGILILVNNYKGELESKLPQEAEVVFIPAIAGG